MNDELLSRIEKLEQAVQDIWASCSCLRKDLDDDIDICYGPEEEPELPEEPDCVLMGCESCGAEYPKSMGHSCPELEEEPEEVEDE